MKQLTREQQAFQQRSELILGRKLYKGDGIVYHLKNYPKRVIKIVSRENRCDIRRAIKTLNYLKSTNNPAVVRLYDIGGFSYVDQNSECRMYCYYYVMDKLIALPKTKWQGGYGYVRKIQDALFDRDNRQVKNIPRPIKMFLNQVRKIKHFYYDCHAGNLMLTKQNKLKLIDLESFM